MEINQRFEQTKFIKAVKVCNSSSKMFLDFNTFWLNNQKFVQTNNFWRSGEHKVI